MTTTTRTHSQARPIPESWIEAIDGFDYWLAAADKSPRTRELRRYQLGRVARAFPAGPDKVTLDGLLKYLARQNWDAETRRGTRACLRSFYAWATIHGIVEQDPAKNLPTVKRGQVRPRPVPDEVWLGDRELADARCRLIMDLGAELGLRRAEIAVVHRRDVIPYGTGWGLVVHGKGRRQRVVPLADELANRLMRFSGWAFPSTDHDQHLTPDRVGRLVCIASRGNWSTHHLRHRFATAVYNATGDLLSTQQLLGHSKPETTQGYVLVADDRLRAAAATACRRRHPGKP